ncbi:MAG: 2-octaprenyl-6-methoxyphenyl hydroxylase, partial [Rhizobacter sp.]|nr:2-octaprenyl-6-methoxyphenyl hydroxylase [Rhizobacter sp.]
MNIAVIGAGPVGLALAIHAARMLPAARITVFDARPLDKDVSGDGRTLAMSLGSVQWLERLGAWPADKAQPITRVHVSQQPSGFAFPIGEPKVVISATDLKVPMLGAALSYGEIVTPLQRVWTAAVDASAGRLASRFGQKVQGIEAVAGGVEIDVGAVGIDDHLSNAEPFDLAVVAEGSVMAEQNALASAPTLRHDYRQTAWVGQVTLDGIAPGVAFERFTRQGPAALLPLKGNRAALVWCVASDADPVRDLTDAQRVAMLNTIFHRDVGHITSITPLKHFPLALNAQRRMVSRIDGARVVHIGNAAQTLHPVAGQGLNLGLL